MIQVPKYIADLIPYKPGKSSDPADFSRYKAILSSNENNYGPSSLAMKAITEAANSVHLYPDPQSENLIESLSRKHELDSNRFIVSNGLDGLLYSIYKAFTVPGDQVVTNDRSFIAFNKFGAMYDVEVALVKNLEYEFDLDGVLEMINERTKIVYLCNPNNPTGSIIPAADLTELIAKIPKHILVIVDEAYFEYAQKIDSQMLDSSQLLLDNVLTLRTFSKLYGLAGLRIGYGIGSDYVIEALKKVKLVFNPNTLAQVAANAALQDKEHVSKTLDNNTYWINELQMKLAQKEIRCIKSSANFICTIFSSQKAASDFYEYMDRSGILLRKLDGFQMPECIRISIGNNEEMKFFSEVLTRFE